MIIIICNPKGGAGRSTIALNLAAAAAASGASTLVIDTDKSRAIDQAFKRRGLLTETFKTYEIDQFVNYGSNFPERLTYAASKYDVTILDTPAEINSRIHQLIYLSDVVVVPTSAGCQDLEKTIEFLSELTIMRQYRATFKVLGLLNQWGDAETFNAIALKALRRSSGDLPLLHSAMHHRSEYTTAFTFGLGALEYDPESEAAAESKAIYNEIRWAAR